MAWLHPTQNKVYGGGTTGSTFIYDVRAGLVAGGWTIVADSDGTTYSSSGTQVTSGGSGAHGFANASAWFCARNPDGSLYLTVQRSTSSNITGRVKGHLTAPTGGSAAQVPASADEWIILGAGTDASPTFAQWIGASDASSYWGNVSVQTTSPYLVHAFAYTGWVSGGGITAVHTKFCVDKVQAWSAPTGDDCPWMIHAAGGSSGADTLGVGGGIDSDTGLMGVRVRAPASGGTHSTVIVPALTLMANNSANQTFPGGAPLDQADSKYPLLPLAYCRRAGASSPQVWKGYSTLFAWNPITSSGTGVLGDLYTTDATGDSLVTSNVVALGAWNNVTLTSTGQTNTTRAGFKLQPTVVPTAPPVVANLSPAAGSSLGPFDPVAFDVTDAAGLRRVVVYAVQLPGGPWEVVHANDVFAPGYQRGSSRTAITNGYHYVVARDAGWIAPPTLAVDAVDTAGNEN